MKLDRDEIEESSISGIKKKEIVNETNQEYFCMSFY